MSLWTRILEAIEALANGESIASVLESLTTPPERTVAFAIAVIGLGAKVAKADGQVTRDEVTAFREVFHIEPADEANAARIFNLARQDVAGFEAYAATIARMFRNEPDVLVDLLEGMFHIATADGYYHPDENSFLDKVAEIFGLSDRQFKAIRVRFVPDAEPDPYAVLGVDPEDDLDTIKTRWRKLVKKNHPDRILERGVPEEAIKLATDRMSAINTAWKAIQQERAAS